MMIAYVAYVVCVLALVGISYGLGYGSGRRHRAEINLSLIERDACGRCTYMERCLKMYGKNTEAAYADLMTHYCKDCAVGNEINKMEG